MARLSEWPIEDRWSMPDRASDPDNPVTMASGGIQDKEPPFANYLGGRWQPSLSGATYEKRNPARPSEVIGRFPASNELDVDAATEAAEAAFPDWSSLPMAKRGEYLERVAAAIGDRADAIAHDMTMEMGKPLREARVEAARAAQVFRFFAGETLRPLGEVHEQMASGNPLYTRRRPLGIVALIAPWNFPLAIPAWKLAAAIAFGNTAVLKLAQESPLTGLHLAACLDEAGLPEGACSILVGRGSELGSPLVSHPLVKAISFTGSVEVGSRIRLEAAEQGKRAQLELGGHNPLIVLADADLDRAIEATYAGAFWSAGQKCTATRRIYVQEPIYEQFKNRLLERIEQGVVGDPADPDTEVGPMVNETQLEKVLLAIDRGKEEGGTVIAGGERLGNEGYLLEPTLFENVADDAFLSCEEVFGPVTSMYPFSTLDDALRRANAVRFGLTASLFTRDAEAIQRFVTTIEAGIVRVNQQTAGADVHVPFGGLKGSGYGPHEQGRTSKDFFTDVVTVYQDV
jgi:alpha-ketoglutaric semialdehyde dehydrogenase